MDQFKAIESVKMCVGEKNRPWSGPVGEKNRPTCSIYIPGQLLLKPTEVDLGLQVGVKFDNMKRMVFRKTVQRELQLLSD